MCTGRVNLNNEGVLQSGKLNDVRAIANGILCEDGFGLRVKTDEPRIHERPGGELDLGLALQNMYMTQLQPVERRKRGDLFL